MKQENINKLQKDLDLLIDKHSKFIEKNDFGSALNVMKNIDFLTIQLRNIDYETKVSKFSIPETDGIAKRLISIWKQNSFGDIKDTETYYLGEKYKENMEDVFNKLSKNWDTMPDEMKNNFISLFKNNNITSKKEIKSDWYNILEYFIKIRQSQLIKLDYTDEDKVKEHRFTGKTTALIQLSCKYNIPILVKDKTQAKLLIERCGCLGSCVYYVIKDTTESYHNSILLVDEMYCDTSNLQNEYDDTILIGFTK
jgi:hypothetical protein